LNWPDSAKGTAKKEAHEEEDKWDFQISRPVNKDTNSAQNDERNGRQGKRRSKGKEGGRRRRVMRTDRGVVHSLEIHGTPPSKSVQHIAVIAVIHVLVGEHRR
jgi:hypothetical protein